MYARIPRASHRAAVLVGAGFGALTVIFAAMYLFIDVPQARVVAAAAAADVAAVAQENARLEVQPVAATDNGALPTGTLAWFSNRRQAPDARLQAEAARGPDPTDIILAVLFGIGAAAGYVVMELMGWIVAIAAADHPLTRWPSDDNFARRREP